MSNENEKTVFVSDSFEIDIHGKKVVHVIEELQKVITQCGDDNCCVMYDDDVEITIRYSRPETQKEKFMRIATYKTIQERKRLAQETKNKREYDDYLRLSKKFAKGKE